MSMPGQAMALANRLLFVLHVALADLALASLRAFALASLPALASLTRPELVISPWSRLTQATLGRGWACTEQTSSTLSSPTWLWTNISVTSISGLREIVIKRK